MSTGLPNPKASSGKIIASLLGGFALLVLLCALFLPAFFSSSPGKKILLRMIEKRSGIKLEIDALSLSWFGEQSALGIRLQKPEDQLMVTCKEAATDSPLWKIALKNDLGHLKLSAPSLQIAKPFQSMAQVKKAKMQGAAFAVDPGIQLAMPAFSLPVTGEIEVTDGKLSFTPPEMSPIVFNQVVLLMGLRASDQLSFNLSCSTTRQEIQGQIAIQGTASDIHSPSPKIALSTAITQLPVLGVDQLVSIFSPKLSGLIYGAVGPTIDINCQFLAGEGNFALSLKANSPQLNAQIVTQTTDGAIVLKNPATFTMNVAPAFVEKWGKLSPALAGLQLTRPATLQATLSEFSCPLPLSGSDLGKASFAAQITAPQPLLLSLRGTPLAFNQFALQTSSDRIDERISLALSTSLQTANQPGAITLNGVVTAPLSASPGGSLNLNAAKLPVDLIGVVAGLSSPLSPLLGPTADLSAAVSLGTAPSNLQLSWQSAYLTLPSLNLSLNNPWTLASPASLTFTLNPQLGTADPIQGTLQTLVIPTNNLQAMRLEAALKTGKIALAGELPLQIAPSQATLSVNTLSQISFTIDGAPLKASLTGSYNLATAEFTLQKPLTAQYVVDNAFLQAMTKSAPFLAQPANVQLSIDPFVLPLSGFSVASAKLQGQLSLSQATFGETGKQITVQKTSLPFQWDGKGKTATIQLASDVQNPGGAAGSMQGQFNLTQFSTDKGLDFNKAAVQGSLDVQNISTSLLDAFTGSTTWSTLAGPTFSAKSKLQSTPDKQNLALQWTSQNLKVDTAFAVDKGGLQLQGPANQVVWTLTPDAYKVLDQMVTGPTNGKVPFTLSEASTFTLSLSKLTLPVTPAAQIASFADRFPSVAFDLKQLQLGFTGRNPKVAFFDKSSNGMIQLTNLSFSLGKGVAGTPLALSFDSGVVTQETTSSTAQVAKNGSLSITGQLLPTYDAQGAFDISQLTTNLQIKAQQLPSRALDIIARAQGRTDFPFTSALGNMINAAINLDLKNFGGPVSLNLNTPTAKADLSGHLANGALLLNNELYAQINITPELSRLFLKEVNPLNLSYLYSQAPVTLQVRSEGFYLPVYPYNAAKIAIPDARIELGKIVCRNEGNVNIALGLLKTKQFDKSNDLTLWFAPIDLSVKQGITNIDRTEILLADTFDICTWGQVDLVKDYVDMTLGLTAQTLSKAFGIKNLPANYVLTIPMKGPSDNVQINTGKATAKVALLLAWQNKNAAGAIGGPAGAIVGDLLGKIATLPDANAKVPPAKHPFPWEIGKPSKSSSNHEKKRQFKAGDKPLKQILKVIR